MVLMLVTLQFGLCEVGEIYNRLSIFEKIMGLDHLKVS